MTFHVKHSNLDAEWHAAIVAARDNPSPEAFARVAVLANTRRLLALEAERERTWASSRARLREAPSDDEDDNAERRLHRTLLDEDE